MIKAVFIVLEDGVMAYNKIITLNQPSASSTTWRKTAGNESKTCPMLFMTATSLQYLIDTLNSSTMVRRYIIGLGIGFMIIKSMAGIKSSLTQQAVSLTPLVRSVLFHCPYTILVRKVQSGGGKG